MSTITAPVSPKVARGTLIAGVAVVGVAVIGLVTTPRLTSAGSSTTETGTTTTVVTTARAGGPDALALHRRVAVVGRSSVDASALQPGGSVYRLQVPSVLSMPRVMPGYAPGGSVYLQQVPRTPEPGYGGPTSPDAVERWQSGVPVPKRGYR